MTQTEDLLDLLAEAATEIANLDGMKNPVFQRLRLALKLEAQRAYAKAAAELERKAREEGEVGTP